MGLMNSRYDAGGRNVSGSFFIAGCGCGCVCTGARSGNDAGNGDAG
jgi:hypothetical protein